MNWINKKIKIIVLNVLFFLIFLLILDNLIFNFSYLLPKNFVRLLSYPSQIKYQLINGSDETDKIYDDYISYYKPNFLAPDRNDKTDGLGYRNPENLLKESPIKVLLIGDSFTEAPLMGENFRKLLDPKTYSIGMGGQGIYHWKYHFKRFKNSKYYNNEPEKILILYYEGNDIADTLRAIKYKEKGYVNSIYYPSSPHYDNYDLINRKFSFFHEIKSLINNFLMHYRVRYQIRKILDNFKFDNETVDNFLKKRNLVTYENQFNQNSYVEYDDKCLILQDPLENQQSMHFSEKERPTIVREINNLVNLIDQDKTSIFFIYLPSTLSVYYYKTDINNFDIQKNNSNNFKKFLEKINVLFIDPTAELQLLSKQRPLHPCDGTDNHFNNYGYSSFVKIVTDKINTITNIK